MREFWSIVLLLIFFFFSLYIFAFPFALRLSWSFFPPASVVVWRWSSSTRIIARRKRFLRSATARSLECGRIIPSFGEFSTVPDMSAFRLLSFLSRSRENSNNCGALMLHYIALRRCTQTYHFPMKLFHLPFTSSSFKSSMSSPFWISRYIANMGSKMGRSRFESCRAPNGSSTGAAARRVSSAWRSCLCRWCE